MSVIGSNTLAGASGQGGGGGYEIERSLRFNSIDSANLSRTPTSEGNRNTFTFSFWVKRTALGINNRRMFGADASGVQFNIMFDANDRLYIQGGLHPNTFALITERKFRDPSAWYHFVISFDKNAATTVRIYCNGSEITTFATSDYPVSTDSFGWNATVANYIGTLDGTNGNWDGMLANVDFIDGRALAPSDFGEYDDNNVWQPKEFDGTYGPSVNQSQTWSSAITGTYNGSNDADNLFDGNTSNQTIPATGTSLTFTPSSAITGITKIRIKLSCDPNHTDEFKVNGVDQTGTLTKDSVTRDLDYTASQLTSIVWSTSSNNHWIALKQISVEVNGFWVVLVDSGVSIGNNSFHLDFSDTSSDSALGTDSSGNGNDWTVNNLYADTSFGSLTGSDNNTPDKYGTGAFSGATANTSNFNRPNGNGDNEYLIWTPLAPRTAGSTLKVYLDVQTKTGTRGLYVNGSDVSSHVTVTANTPATSIHEWSVNLSTANITSVTSVTTPQMSSGTTYLHGISIDGTYVADYGLDVDQSTDSPSQIADQTDTGVGGELTGNYCTMNPLNNGSNVTLSNGNLETACTTTGWGIGERSVGTFGMRTGKWYWENTINTANYTYTGMISSGNPSVVYPGADSTSISLTTDNGLYHGGVGNTTNHGTGMGSDSFTLMYAFDADNGKFWFGKNGTWLTIDGTNVGNPSTGANALNLSTEDLTYWPTTITYGSINCKYNFGQRPFAYTAPSGYKCLCTANLPEPTIADGSQYFDTLTYSGNGSARTLTGLNMNPGFIWIKSRSSAQKHILVDSVRTTSTGEYLASDSTQAEGTGVHISGTANGITIADPNASTIWYNDSSHTYVAWTWDAGSSNTTIAAGSLNSSVLDQSQTWSTYGTFTNTYGGTYDWPGVFNDGFTWDAYGSLYTDGSAKWTLTSTIPCSSKVRIYIYGPGIFTINEGLSDATAITVTTTGFQYAETTFSGNISNFHLAPGTNNPYLMRIYVDGKALIDSGTTMNFPSIASTVRANPSAGFSIVKWNNGTISSTASVAHGLSSAPDFYIIKSIDSSDSWYTYHNSMGNTKYLTLDTDTAATTSSVMWGDTSPDSNTFPVGTTFNGTGDYIAYCFVPVEGYSSFGSYVGNGSSTNGTFVYTGFRPAWLLTKRTDGGSNDWQLIDVSRSPLNVADDILKPNSSNAENTHSDNSVDFLSNGFKHRTGHVARNGSGNTYIYAAFAEHPFKTARAR